VHGGLALLRQHGDLGQVRGRLLGKIRPLLLDGVEQSLLPSAAQALERRLELAHARGHRFLRVRLGVAPRRHNLLLRRAAPVYQLAQLEHARALLAVDLVLPLGLGRLVHFRHLARLGAVLGAKRARLVLRGRGGTEG